MVINLALIGVPGEEEAPLITPVNGECLLLLVRPLKQKLRHGDTGTRTPRSVVNCGCQRRGRIDQRGSAYPQCIWGARVRIVLCR